MGRTSPEPLKKTCEFYKSIDKSLKKKLILSKNREAYLEDKTKMKVFTGDSNLIHTRKSLGKLDKFIKEKTEEMQASGISSV